MPAEDAIKTTVDELLKVLSARNILGEPIEMEDKVILPVTKMGMGFGAGAGQSTQDKPSSGGGAGGAVGVLPMAVVIVFKGISGPDGVKVIPLTAPNPMADSIAELTTVVLGKLTGKKEGTEKKRPSGHTSQINIE
jgi:uncharacterized spore protein YtfJ